MMRKVTSLCDLSERARTDKRYEKLAMISAKNLGGSPKSLQEALRWLDINAMETNSEDGVVDEVNFCIDLV